MFPASPNTLCASPASSTSTLTALDDDELRLIWNPKDDALNPRAVPFVPKLSPSTPPPSPPRRSTQPAAAKPPPIWFPIFTAAARASAIPSHPSRASALVASRSWPIEAIAELAQHFCWRGGDKPDAETPGIAPFAHAVYTAFIRAHGRDVAQSFLWHLRECVVGAFIASWDPDCPNAITYRFAPSFAYVASATAQAAFVGELFRRELIPGAHAATCVVAILKGLNSYEHLEALRGILAATGPAFWHGTVPGQGNTAIHRFVATFLETVAPLRPNMSVLGRSLKATDMSDMIVDIEQLVTSYVQK
ncbi:hypothetical protein MKEN_01433400 [Mycena kentingensis (nom. inval.)]|nr:hypothetical protein MKEN_01433400 [Mycena kentingensis (nom. inval.)]